MGQRHHCRGDDQARRARDAAYRHIIIGLRSAIATIEKRLVAPTMDMLTVSDRKARRKAKAVNGYGSQAEGFATSTHTATRSGPPKIHVDLTGSASRRDAQVRH